MFLTRRLSVAVLLWFAFTCLVFAQNPVPQQDDNTDTAVQRQRAQARARSASRTRDMGEEEDDATARLEWQRHAFGVHTAQSKRQLLRQRAERSAARANGNRAGISGNSDVSSARFSSDLPQTGSNPSDPTWVSIGPADAEYEQNGAASAKARDSGRARAILPHPTDANTLYFLTSGGGLWVTNNFLSDPPSWRPLTDNLPTTGGGSAAFGSLPPNPVAGTPTIYLGLGDPFDVINVGGAMVKSVDAGQTWTNFVELGAAQSVRDVKVIPGSPDIVLVATDIGLFRSIDGGVSYTQVQDVVGPEPTFHGKALWNIVQTSAGYLVEAQSCPFVPADLCGSAGIIYVSTDQGAAWTVIPNTGSGFSGAGRATLAVGAPGDSIVYALAGITGSENAQKDVFKSTDGGLTWTALGVTAKAPTNPNGNNTNMDIMHAQAWYNQLILVDPRDVNRNTLYIGGNLSSAKSTDGGNTWTLISDWIYGEINLLNGVAAPSPAYAHADFHTAKFAVLNGTPTLLFGNDGGLYVSTDGGTTWSSNKNTGLETFLLYDISASTKFPNNAIVGAQDNGTRVRKDNTKVFNQSIGGDGLGNGWSKDSQFVYGTAAGGSYRRSVLQHVPSRIQDWESFSLPSQSGDAGVFATPIELPSAAADPSGRVVYTFTSKRAFQLTSGPTTFTARTIAQLPNGSATASNGLTTFTGRSFRGQSHALGVSPVDLNHVAVGMNAGGLAISSDATASPNHWTVVELISAVPMSGGRTWVGFNANVVWVDNSTLYVTSEAPGTNAIRIARSMDGGATWAAADGSGGTNPLPDGRVNRVVVDPRDVSKNTLFAGSDLGVFKSTDGGANWSAYGNGLPNVRVSDIYMPPDGSFLMAATYGRGVWELPSLSHAGSTLVDDGLSCDKDGVLDAGETGHFNITLHNDGSGTFNAISATVTSTNPNVTFPNGNTINFPAAGPNSDVTASLAVALNGATTGIQQIDFNIAYTDSSLNLPTAVTTLASFRANYDEVPNSSTSDNIEAANSPWTITGQTTNPPDLYQWERREIGPLEHRWGITNSNVPSDQSLVSPVMHVGSGNFVFSYEQRHFFETGFDGMVVEISTDNGSSWNDVGAAALTPTYAATPLVTPDDNPLSGRRAFTGRSTTYPSFVPVTVNLGTQFAGQDVRIRFRVGTDTLGFGTGIEIRNIAVSGITNTPFNAVIPHRGVCPTGITISSNNNPSFFGDTVTFSTSISGGVTVATGSVTFKDGGTAIGSGALDNSGLATFSTSTLAVGSHSITSEYAGDATHAASVSDAITQLVNRTQTSTTVVSSVNPSSFGQLVTLTATVTGGTTPTGTITFMDGSTVLGTQPLDGSGHASFTISTLAVGPHSITAEYGGDATHDVSTSSALAQTVNPAGTTLQLASSLNPSMFGQAVTFAATLNQATATGTTKFTDGALTLATVPLNGGSASFTTSALTGGSHSISVTYSGDADFSSSSASLTQTVNRAPSTTAASSSLNPSSFGQAVTLTATVTPSTATGNVTFSDGATVVTTVAVNGGIASFTTAALAGGSHAITMSYTGDGNYLGSSASLTQVVSTSGSTTALTSTQNPSTFEQAITFTATVAPQTATGTVTFKEGFTVLGTATVINGLASFTTSALAAGMHVVIAMYSGDGNFGGSASGPVSQVVKREASTTSLSSSQNPTPEDTPVTFTATISSKLATGKVVFFDRFRSIGEASVNAGVAKFTTSKLERGTHPITAVYSGDANIEGSASSQVNEEITKKHGHDKDEEKDRDDKRDRD
jgi:hypothetical protein